MFLCGAIVIKKCLRRYSASGCGFSSSDCVWVYPSIAAAGIAVGGRVDPFISFILS